MPKYARYNPMLTVAPILGWYDTDAYIYNEEIPGPGFFPMTDEQWTDRTTAISWVIDDGVLEPTPTPGPTDAQLAAIQLANRIANGIALASTGNPSLNATYALDETSTAQIFQIGLYANQFGVFPSGGTMQVYPDIMGLPHVFSVAEYIAFLRAVAPLVSSLTTQAGIMAQGGTPSWPTQAATIV